MTELLRTRRELWLPVIFGLAAAAVSIAPVGAAVPAALLLFAFSAWIVAAPTRWIPCFLIAAILLPPLPIRLGESGPHPALFLAALGLCAGVARLRDWRIRTSSVCRDRCAIARQCRSVRHLRLSLPLHNRRPRPPRSRRSPHPAPRLLVRRSIRRLRLR